MEEKRTQNLTLEQAEELKQWTNLIAVAQVYKKNKDRLTAYFPYKDLRRVKLADRELQNRDPKKHLALKSYLSRMFTQRSMAVTKENIEKAFKFARVVLGETEEASS